VLDLSSLNQNQLEAVQWQDGPLLVLAGPGSGKTRVLTMRVARLLADSPHKRFRILALTFTTKAAGEMRERLEQLVPDLHRRAWMTTFHAFAAEVLRQHGTHVGLRPNFTILTLEADRQAVLSDAIRELSKKGLDVNDDERLPAPGVVPLSL
jgi:ATP-dependent DNA helicase UvrD/PcrA